VKLCIDSEETRGLGIENHVCELQLVLHGFAPAQVCVCKRKRESASRERRGEGEKERDGEGERERLK
jgi:hypothetical protein